MLCAYFLSSEFRHYHPQECYFFVSCCILAVVFIVVNATVGFNKRAAKSKIVGYEVNTVDPTLWYFFAMTSVVALLLGCLAGQFIFNTNTSMCLAATDLNIISDVDPLSMPSKAFLDAGAIVFLPGTKVNQSMSLGYKDWSTYCVAPVTRTGLVPASYNFWAVGLDCCNPFGGSFWCGESNNPRAHAGWRLMESDKHVGYKLAVRMAEAEYGIVAMEPMFFRWGEDPTSAEAKNAPYHPDQCKAPARVLYFKSSLGFLFLQVMFILAFLCYYQKLYLGLVY